VKKSTGGTGLKIVNSDDVFEKYLKQAKLDFKMSATQGKARDALRTKAKVVTAKRKDNYLEGRLGLVIDGTGKDFNKISSQAAGLRQLGYDTHMIFVNTTLEVALQRNQERDRILPPDLLEKSWKDVQQNLGSFQNLFKNNFVIVDNSKHLNAKESEAKFVPLVTKVVRKFVAKPIKNKLGLKWIEKQKKLNRRK